MTSEGDMVEDFRTRMGDLREEINRIAGQAEELERVVREQQVRLEEMDLLVRQRDEQLAERQARVEELERTLRQREEEVAALRAQLAEREQTLIGKEDELAALRAQLVEREAAESALRAELARAGQPPSPPVVEVPIEAFLERIGVIENLVNGQGESISALRTLLQQEMAGLHARLDRLEARLAAAPVPAVAAAPLIPWAEEIVAPPVPQVEEVAAPPMPQVEEVAAPLPPQVEEVAALLPPQVEEVAAVAPAAVPVLEVVPPVAEVVAPPPAVTVADSLQVVLQETLEMLPEASLVGLAGRDGLSVEMLARREPAFPQPLEVELADLSTEATRVATALGAGPLLTIAFQAGDDHLLLSPVGEEHFAYLLTPADSPADFRRAQAVLLQAASRIGELL
jgi:predicted regulator of Ras-like GTPase activity (Roadblock/LC7/MglB family)